MKKTILVVDDENSVLELIKSVLELDGYNVVTAETGEQTFKVLKEVRPDLILLDVMMPDVNGIKILERIKNNPELEETHVILLTVLSLEEIEKINTKKLKFKEHIQKPFDNKALIDKVKHLVKKNFAP